VWRVASECRQAEASEAGLLWLDLSNPLTEHMVLGVDYVKQRAFFMPLRLPNQTGCRRRAHTRREWLRFNLHTKEIGEIVQLKESNPNTFLPANYKL
jgi:hypothetical protein